MSRIKRGWQLTKKSWALLRENPELLRFPLYGGAATTEAPSEVGVEYVDLGVTQIGRVQMIRAAVVQKRESLVHGHARRVVSRSLIDRSTVRQRHQDTSALLHRIPDQRVLDFCRTTLCQNPMQKLPSRPWGIRLRAYLDSVTCLEGTAVAKRNIFGFRWPTSVP